MPEASGRSSFLS